ncbi:Protein LTV1 -like protein [Halotydeus destructor]|nr:Protein LTV1 -like protein [Halotydeus destructor]
MPKLKKIDKKTAITFKLVHRSQQDPLITDPTAPQHVLVEVGRRRSRPVPSLKPELKKEEAIDPQTRKIEQRKYGVYFDDDYNYLQHLKNADDIVEENVWEPVDKHSAKSKLMLPSSVFASKVEEKEGMLNKAALPVGPQPDWDPEVVAALDEDFDFENPDNTLDDDFVVQAMDGNLAQVATDSKQKFIDAVENSDEEFSDEETISSGNLSGDEEFDQFGELETKSHFTNYSLTSSVMRRNKGLSLLDERFETLYENEYGEDTTIGALDAEDIEGYIEANNDSILNHLVEDFEKDRTRKGYEAEVLKTKVLRSLLTSEEMVDIEIDDNAGNLHPDDRLDCESIISTYSNMYNHPKLIYEPKVGSNKIRINPSTGIPFGVLSKRGLTARNLKALDSVNSEVIGADTKSVMSAVTKLSQLSIRPAAETPQERKARKCALKALRKERRTERKANKIAFKQEHHRQEKEMINIRQNLSCVRLV